MHTEVTGLIDLVVDTDEEALDAIKRFLSYLPSHHNEAPPVRPVAGRLRRRHAATSSTCCPSRTQVYDMRKVVRRASSTRAASSS